MYLYLYSPASPYASSSSSSFSYTASPPIAMSPFSYMHVPQHTLLIAAPQTVSPSPQISAPQANIACVSTMVQADTRWFPDSGATNVVPNPYVTT